MFAAREELGEGELSQANGDCPRGRSLAWRVLFGVSVVARFSVVIVYGVGIVGLIFCCVCLVIDFDGFKFSGRRVIVL